MNQPLLDTVITFVEVGSVTVKRAMDENSVHQQAQKRASELRGPLLDHLVTNQIVAEHQKEAADAMLSSHAESLQLLKCAADKIVELKKQLAAKAAGDLGHGETEKTSGLDAHGKPFSSGNGQYDSLTDPRVGLKTSEKKASDYALLKALDNHR